MEELEQESKWRTKKNIRDLNGSRGNTNPLGKNARRVLFAEFAFINGREQNGYSQSCKGKDVERRM
jgi:hypothetical protein